MRPLHADFSANADPRLARVRRLAWILDRSIPIGGGRAIGLDPIIGLIPGLGDWIAAGLSLYVFYEAARLGLPFPVLGRIGLNILIEAIVGAVPVLGDLFDFVWQANVRNVRLVEQHYRPSLPPRSFNQIWFALLLFAILLLSIIGFALYGLFALFTALVG